jgi:transcriptional regulator with XRE-family HTH domain
MSRNGEQSYPEAALLQDEPALRSLIAARVRDARKNLGLTARELGDRVGVTRSFISQVERAEVTPSLQTMLRITHALGIPMADLFEATRPATDAVLRPADWEIYHYPGDASDDAVLSVDPEKRLEVVWSRLPPGGASAEPVVVEGADIEFILVLRGQVVLIVDGTRHVLDEHCSITIDGRKPHDWINETDEPVEFIAVMARRPPRVRKRVPKQPRG